MSDEAKQQSQPAAAEKEVQPTNQAVLLYGAQMIVDSLKSELKPEDNLEAAKKTAEFVRNQIRLKQEIEKPGGAQRAIPEHLVGALMIYQVTDELLVKIERVLALQSIKQTLTEFLDIIKKKSDGQQEEKEDQSQASPASENAKP